MTEEETMQAAPGADAVELRADGITKWFATGRSRTGRPALDDASITVRSGEFVAIVGESGSGKSTLARVLLQLIEPTEGTVLFEGESVAGLGVKGMRRFRRSVQAVLQDPSGSLNPRKSIATSIGEVVRFHRIARRSADVDALIAESLRQVGLDADLHADRFPHELSGGQRQRVLIARALVLGPKLIVADEAVSALDVSIKAGVLKLMRDLQQQLGLGYVFITHDLPVVKKVASYVYVMRHGSIVEHGPKDEIFDNPKHPYTQELLAATPVLSASIPE